MAGEVLYYITARIMSRTRGGSPWPIEMYQEGINMQQPTAPSSSAPTSHCDGCDQLQPDVREYSAEFVTARDSDGDVLSTEWQVVFYCPACHELASQNYNGDTLEIQPVAVSMREA